MVSLQRRRGARRWPLVEQFTEARVRMRSSATWPRVEVEVDPRWIDLPWTLCGHRDPRAQRWPAVQKRVDDPKGMPENRMTADTSARNSRRTGSGGKGAAARCPRRDPLFALQYCSVCPHLGACMYGALKKALK
jgi:2-methylcitrate dehydratase PrpD